MRFFTAACTGFLVGALLSSVQDAAWGWTAVLTVGLAAGLYAMAQDKGEA